MINGFPADITDKHSVGKQPGYRLLNELSKKKREKCGCPVSIQEQQRTESYRRATKTTHGVHSAFAEHVPSISLRPGMIYRMLCSKSSYQTNADGYPPRRRPAPLNTEHANVGKIYSLRKISGRPDKCVELYSVGCTELLEKIMYMIYIHCKQDFCRNLHTGGLKIVIDFQHRQRIAATIRSMQNR